MVLKENMKFQVDREKKGKFEPTLLDPYVVTTSFGFGAYQLSTFEGEPLNDPTNIIHLNKFYAWASSVYPAKSWENQKNQNSKNNKKY